MDKRLQKYRPILGMMPLAGSIIASGSIAQLPPTTLNDGLRMALGGASLVGIAKTWCDADEADQKRAYRQPQIEADDAVRASVIESEARMCAAYYKRYPHHFRANKPVPREWLDLWAATSGQPHLAQHNQILALAPVQGYQVPQPQQQTYQGDEYGGVRGGSFDRAAADNPGSGWGDFEPRPQQPIAAQPTLTNYSPPAQSSIAQAEYTPRLFDWQSFVTNPDLFPHVCVLGATGNGKTSLQEWLARLIGGGNELIILTTKKKGMQWHGLPITGLGRDFAPISQKWRSIEAALNTRCADLDLAQSQPQIICAIDELNDIIANSDLDLANVARAGREARLRLIVNSHSEGVDGLGLKGKNDIKACFVWVRLGQFAINHAQMLANKGLIETADIAWLKAQHRPCMVGDAVAQIPSLPDGWQGRLGGSQHQPSPPPHQTPEPQSPPSFEPVTPPMVQGSGFGLNRPEPPKIAPSVTPEPMNDREAELLAQFAEFKALGMNKAQICYAIWGAKKGGSAQYKMASEFYERLNSKYLEISGDNAA
jgi:hypothetical protein